MTARDLAQDIGKRGQLTLDRPGPMTAPVVVVDARESYGRVQWLVEVVGGVGQAWVSVERVTVDPADCQHPSCSLEFGHVGSHDDGSWS